MFLKGTYEQAMNFHNNVLEREYLDQPDEKEKENEEKEEEEEKEKTTDLLKLTKVILHIPDTGKEKK